MLTILVLIARPCCRPVRPQAKALRLAILTKRMHDNRRAIFLLHHQGDFDTPPFITRVVINDDTRQMEEVRSHARTSARAPMLRESDWPRREGGKEAARLCMQPREDSAVKERNKNLSHVSL